MVMLSCVIQVPKRGSDRDTVTNGNSDGRPATQGASDGTGRINVSTRNKIPPIGGPSTPTSVSTPNKSATLGDTPTDDG